VRTRKLDHASTRKWAGRASGKLPIEASASTALKNAAILFVTVSLIILTEFFEFTQMFAKPI
jgi:hypothetical protein